MIATEHSTQKGRNVTWSGHILGLSFLRLSNAAPFYENYTKLYSDAKHLEKGLNRGGFLVFFISEKVSFFHKKMPFLANFAALNFFGA